jgi:hypothetical protein
MLNVPGSLRFGGAAGGLLAAIVDLATARSS